MIDTISLSNTASYATAPETLTGLSQFNFIFGTNGCGKTTISRVLADETQFPGCTVTWKGGTKLHPMVYNRDFVEKHFAQSAELKGVFTLGEKHVDALAKIATATVERDGLTQKLAKLRGSLQGEDGNGGKRGEQAVLEAALKDRCWVQYKKHEAKLKGAFEGYRGSTEKFKGKILGEWASNTATLQPLADLEHRAGVLFDTTPTVEPAVPAITFAALIEYESASILKKRVVGKEDVDIAAMIATLSNSDWVREGVSYFEANQRVCPFCQQDTPDSFSKSLRAYFDKTFETDTATIKTLIANYKTEAARLQQDIEAIIAAPSKFLDVDKLKLEKELLDSKTSINSQRLTDKQKEPSRQVELESVSNVRDAITALIGDANKQVSDHNAMVANLADERKTLTDEVWKYLLEVELKAELEAYMTKRDGLTSAVQALTERIRAVSEEIATKTAEIRELEKQVTSIQPTIDGINGLLKSFGFQGFSLAKAENGTSYKLVRADGSDAKATLSEGERTFVTFLYFFHLLKGSDSESGMSTDRIVVFDDPVSSLDSDILFIVGSLIKGLFDEVRSGTGHIKQVFVLTHNVYFHKEVTYNSKRVNVAMTEETFWIVRKPDRNSRVQKHESNPIKTSYELLWSEVRNPHRSCLTIQNTLRRILENYFKILGGIDPDKICGMFEGKERLICKSLFSWVNDGSHYAHDDLYVSVDESMVESYLTVFKSVFQKAQHEAHYKMMMGEAA